jgi:hypothetical protein
MVEHLPSKHETLSSNPNTAKKKKDGKITLPNPRPSIFSYFLIKTTDLGL